MTGARGRAIAGLTLKGETPETRREICTGSCVGLSRLGLPFYSPSCFLEDRCRGAVV